MECFRICIAATGLTAMHRIIESKLLRHFTFLLLEKNAIFSTDLYFELQSVEIKDEWHYFCVKNKIQFENWGQEVFSLFGLFIVWMEFLTSFLRYVCFDSHAYQMHFKYLLHHSFKETESLSVDQKEKGKINYTAFIITYSK